MFGKLRHFINEKKFTRKMAKQRYKYGYALCDCWGMDMWLTTMFPKMILELRDMKHSAPDLEFEEFENLPSDWKDKELKKHKKYEEQNGYDYDPNSVFTKWYILLTRIAFCLQEANMDKEVYNPFQKEYDEALWGKDISKYKTFTEFWYKHCKKVDNGYVLEPKEVDAELEKKYFDYETQIVEYKKKMKDEAMDLIKKYFYNLWD